MTTFAAAHLSGTLESFLDNILVLKRVLTVAQIVTSADVDSQSLQTATAAPPSPSLIRQHICQ